MKKQLFIFVIVVTLLYIPATAWGQDNSLEKHKIISSHQHVYDIAVEGDYIWEGVNGGLILRSISLPEVYRYYHKLNSGLKANQVYSLCVDEKSGVWMATDNGVFYLSPQMEWSHYHKDNSPLEANVVKAVTVGQGDDLWLGTWGGGLYHLDEEGKWQAYNTSNSGIPGDSINTVEVEKDGVWVGTDGKGAAFLDFDGEFTLYNSWNSPLPGNDVLDIAGDFSGGTWFATYQGAAHISPKGEWQVYTTSNSSLPSNIVYSIELKEDDSLWLGTSQGLTYLSDESEFQVKALSSKMVKSISLEGEKALAATWGDGLVGFDLEVETEGDLEEGADPGATEQVEYTVDSFNMSSRVELPSYMVSKVLPFQVDGKTQQIWFSTPEGVSFYDIEAGKWQVFSPEATDNQGAPREPGDPKDPREPIESGESDKNRDKEVDEDKEENKNPEENGDAKENGKNVENRNNSENGENGGFDQEPGANKDQENDFFRSIRCMVEDGQGGVIFISHRQGAAHLDNEGNIAYYNAKQGSLPSNSLTQVLSDGEGGLWFTTLDSGAAYLCPQGDWTLYNTGNGLLPTDKLTSIVLDAEGQPWFGTWDFGLVKMKAEQGWEKFDASNSPLANSDVRSLVIDGEDNLWAATWDGGVARLSINGDWQVFDEAHGNFPGNVVNDLEVDHRGWVWAATSRGASYFDGETWQDYGSPGPEQEVDQISADSYGNIWLSTNKRGIEVFNPREITPFIREWENINAKPEKIMLYSLGEYIEAPINIEEGRSFLPLEYIQDATGARVTWESEPDLESEPDPESELESEPGRILISLEDVKLEMFVGETTYYINGREKKAETSPKAVDGEVFIPIGTVGEGFGFEVLWFALPRTVVITD